MPRCVYLYKQATLFFAGRFPCLEAIAGPRSQTELIETLVEQSGIKSVRRFDDIIKPGESTAIFDVLVTTDRLVSSTLSPCYHVANDAIVVGRVLISEQARAFGSCIVLDAGTENTTRHAKLLLV